LVAINLGDELDFTHGEIHCFCNFLCGNPLVRQARSLNVFDGVLSLNNLLMWNFVLENFGDL
jgi:hypothetical protein